ncbi:MAG: hypothetical protein K1X61_02955 [Chitinophagales bacterium]|nr:hypothetical protein [Chitinophagales bacterium]
MSKHNNKWIHGVTNLVMPPPPKGFMEVVGIYYLSLVLDKNVGEEVVLIIFDPTDFIHDLRAVEPFRFLTSSVAVNTNFGPVYSFIFWVAQANDVNQSFVIFDKPLDISRPTMIEPWRKLANQTHLHLLLVSKNYEVEGFYEFENNFGFDEAVDTISQLDATRVKDFAKAEQEYFNDYALEDLYKMVKNS